MKQIFSIFLSFLASLLIPWAVLASVVTVTENSTLTLPASGDSYTLRSGSTFNNLAVSGGTFVVTLDPKDQIIIVSGSKQNFANSRNIETTCNSSDSQMVQSVATSGAQVVITITPSGTCTVVTATPTGGGGGGGGSSGGGSSGSSTPVPSPSSTPTPSPTPIPTVISTSSQIPAPVPSSLAQPPVLIPATPTASALVPVSPVIISRTLTYGSQGNDVKILQKFLASDTSVYPEGVANGVFGPKTKAAVQRFQEKYGIARNGQQGYGTLGPKTKAKMRELSSTPAASLSTPASSSASVSDLQVQIKMLQDMLNKLKQK